MVTVGVNVSTASVAVCATSVRCDRQGQPQPPPQCDEHAVGGQSGAGLAGDGAEPCGGVWSGLRTQHGLGRGLQGRQQLGLAKVGRAGAGTVVLPALAPLARVGQVALRGAQAIVYGVPE